MKIGRIPLSGLNWNRLLLNGATTKRALKKEGCASSPKKMMYLSFVFSSILRLVGWRRLVWRKPSIISQKEVFLSKLPSYPCSIWINDKERPPGLSSLIAPPPTKSIYLLAEHRRHQILPGLVCDSDIGFQRIVIFVTGEGHQASSVPHLSTLTAYLYSRYDHLLLLDHWRSAPSCEKGGESGISRLLLRRHHIKVWQERICHLSGRKSDWAIFGYWEIIRKPPER